MKKLNRKELREVISEAIVDDPHEFKNQAADKGMSEQELLDGGLKRLRQEVDHMDNVPGGWQTNAIEIAQIRAVIRAAEKAGPTPRKDVKKR